MFEEKLLDHNCLIRNITILPKEILTKLEIQKITNGLKEVKLLIEGEINWLEKYTVYIGLYY